MSRLVVVAAIGARLNRVLESSQLAWYGFLAVSLATMRLLGGIVFFDETMRASLLAGIPFGILFAAVYYLLERYV